MEHLADNGTGPDNGHLHHNVVEMFGRIRGSVAICARLSTWNMPTVSAFCSA
jgi:hypothetical protein